MKILDASKLKITDINNQIKTWLFTTYNQTAQVYSKASPFGHILTVINEYFQLLLLYLEDIAVELNITTASKRRSINGLARLTGHNPARPFSANGTVSLMVKSSYDTTGVISNVIIPDKISLTCTNNSKKYFLSLGNYSGNLKINVNNREKHLVKIIQGTIETTSLAGTGLELQSYSVVTKNLIEHNLVWVTVNGVNYNIVDSLYDIKAGETSCIVKTGISGGIDIYFGNFNFGTVPGVGDLIEVTYVNTEGYNGNIFSKSDSINFKFVGNGYNENGEIVDLNEIIEIKIDKPILMGADEEDMELTKLIAPKTSKAFVLANPDNYIYMLSKFGFAYIDASITDANGDYVSDDNIINLFILPDINKKLDTNTDYFSTDIDNFTLTQYEKDAILTFINNSNQQLISTEVKISDPTITKYAINIILRNYDTADPIVVKSTIISLLSDYFLKVKRRDKIPKSDLIALIEGVEGVDSVNLSFLSSANELAIRDGYYTVTENVSDKITGLITTSTKTIKLLPGEDPNLGLDDFGDIKIDTNEMPLLRGGWYDRYNNYYEDTIDDNVLSSVNIMIKEVIKESLSVKIRNKTKSNIKA